MKQRLYWGGRFFEKLFYKKYFKFSINNAFFKNNFVISIKILYFCIKSLLNQNYVFFKKITFINYGKKLAKAQRSTN